MKRNIALIIAFVFCLFCGISSCIVSIAKPDWRKDQAVVSSSLLAPPVQSATAQGDSVPDLPLPPADTQDEILEETTTPEILVKHYQYTAIHRARRLFIRDEASMEGNIIGYMMPGDSGEVILLGDDWVLLKHNDIEGYTFREYLSIQESDYDLDD